jgi:hypothetical protein
VDFRPHRPDHAPREVKAPICAFALAVFIAAVPSFSDAAEGEGDEEEQHRSGKLTFDILVSSENDPLFETEIGTIHNC